MTTPYKHKPVAFGLPFHGLTPGAEPRNILMNPARVPGPNTTDLDGPNGYDWKSRLLIPGVVGLSNNQIIYIDTAKTPYLITFEIYQESTFVVRVIATLGPEFGVFGEARTNWGTEIFNQTIDLADGSDASYTAVSSAPLSGAVEQGPDGRNTLINIKGLFGSSEELDAGIRTLAGILKASITGAVNPDTGVGLSGSVSVYKTTAECSPPKTETPYDDRSTFHTRIRTNVDQVTTYANNQGGPNAPTPGVGVTVEIDILRELDIVPGSTGEVGLKDNNKIGTPDFTNFSAGNLGTLYEQAVISHAYYDNEGEPHTLGFKLTHDAYTKRTFDLTVPGNTYTIASDYGNYTDINPFFPGKLVANGGGLASESGTRQVGVNLVETRSSAGLSHEYITESMLDASSVESVAYKWTREDIFNVTRWWYTHWPLHFGSNVVDGEYPWDGGPFYDGAYSNPVSNHEVQLGEVDDEILGWDNYSGPTTQWDVEEWGVNTATPITSPAPDNKEFDSVSRQIIGSRFVALVKDDASQAKPAHSAYGATGADHSPYIAYDPYTDTITDSDDPVGYI